MRLARLRGEGSCLTMGVAGAVQVGSLAATSALLAERVHHLNSQPDRRQLAASAPGSRRPLLRR